MAFRKKPNRLAKLFDLRFATVEQRRQSQVKLFQLAGLLVLAGLLLWGSIQWLTSDADDLIRLTGSNVSELEKDAAVMLDGVQVGKVVSVGLDGGEATAMLTIDGQYVDQIPKGSRFEVDSLNNWLPGNVGVKVVPPAEKRLALGTDSQKHANQLSDIAENYRSERAVERVLPAKTPPGTFIAIAIMLLASAIFFGLVLNVARTAWFWNMLIAATILVVVYFVASGRLTLDTVHEKVDQIKLPKERY